MLFRSPDYRKHEREFYQRTGFHPIMHTLVIREELHKEHPWVAESLYKACEEAKRWALKQMRFSGAQRTMLPWLFEEIAEMDALMGDNPWPYGVEANRATLEALTLYLYQQGLTARKVAVDEVFVPVPAGS